MLALSLYISSVLRLEVGIEIVLSLRSLSIGSCFISLSKDLSFLGGICFILFHSGIPPGIATQLSFSSSGGGVNL